MYENGRAITKRVTVPELRQKKGRTPIAMVTAYDFTMARLMDEGGVDAILVGDSLGMVVQGLDNTLPVALEEIAYHARAVLRGASRAHVVGDLPFMSYQVSPEQALESAGHLIKQGVGSVKLEGGSEYARHVAKLTRAGIPVMGHVGLLPQAVNALGGFRVQGRGEDAARVLNDAIALEEAGAYAVVLEAIPPDLAHAITRRLSIPTIGIGAGSACDGQVLVCTDLLGLTRGPVPKFAKQYEDLGERATHAARRYVAEVQAGQFPSKEHAYKPNAPIEEELTRH